MFFQIKSYLSFLVKSTNQHGLHSPFVYQLTTKCFYENSKHPEFKMLKAYRLSLLENHHKIDINDFGAGSKTLNGKKRSISSIAKNAGISEKRAQLLFRLSQYFKAQNILEIGTSLGIATSSFALSNKNANIISLEGCAQTAGIARQQFDQFNLENIRLEVGEFEATLPKVLENTTFDMIYFDGNHQKQPTIDYFERCLRYVKNDSIFIFDDIYWSSGMSSAWEYIKNHSSVTVSIDTFQWGLVFFRKEQPKQHFTIRI